MRNKQTLGQNRWATHGGEVVAQLQDPGVADVIAAAHEPSQGV